MRLLVLIVMLFALNGTLAKTKKPRGKQKKSLVDRYHQRFSKGILAFSDGIDDFFADSQHQELENRSKLIIQFDTFFREAKGPVVVPDINFNLVLPKTQKRLRLFVENENQDTRSETSKASNQQQNTDRPNESNSAAGVRYLVEKSGIKFYQDTGIIVTIPPNFFIRLGAKKSIEYTKWVLKIHERVRWVNTTGLTSDLDLDFDRRLTRKHILRFVNNFFWNDTTYAIRFENGPSLFHKIDRNKALSYHAHVISINEPDFLVTNYTLQVSYRQRLYKKWLFMDVRPFINFPRERNFARTPGLLVGFDTVFGSI